MYCSKKMVARVERVENARHARVARCTRPEREEDLCALFARGESDRGRRAGNISARINAIL